MPKTDKYYKRLADSASPHSPVLKNCVKAFVSGGIICVIGQIISDAFEYMGLGTETAGMWTCIVMIFLGALLTGFGVYCKIAKHAGAGTLVPITGFSNAVVSPALEYKTEGMITGVAAKMFIISGPVIVYGVLSSFICGLIKFLTELVL